MDKFFWTLVSIELAALAILFVIGLNSPSDSGGREMGLVFSVALPFVLLLAVAGVYWIAKSPALKTVALLLAIAPAAMLAISWSRNLTLHRRGDAATVNGFGAPDRRALAQAIVAAKPARVAELAPRVQLNEPSDADLTFLTLALWKYTEATPAIVQSLLAAGADPNRAGSKGWTLPLVRAILLKQPRLVSSLLDAGADPNRRDTYGNVAYHVPLQYPDDVNFEMLRSLLDHGANLEAVDAGQKTALMLAAIFGNARAIGLLLDRGANPHAADKDGKTPLDFVLRRIGEQPDPAMSSFAGRLRQ